MAFWSRPFEFIRDIFSRDQKAQEQAAADADLGDIPIDLFGNLAIQSMQHGITQDHLMQNNALMARFVDYERMDQHSLCSKALDIYADDSTTVDTAKKHVMWTECKDENIRKMLDDMLHKKVNVDDEAWESIRVATKMGNDLEEILVTENGVQGLNFLPTPSVRRLETNRGMLKGFVQSFHGNFQIPTESIGDIKFERGVGKDQRSGVVVFEPWRVVHMRLRSTRRKAMYGVSCLEPGRSIWRRLTLLEDAALISRLARAPSRFAFYVDVGKMPAEKAEKYLNVIRQSMKKKRFINPRTGQLDLRYSPMSSEDDVYLPVREGREVVRADVLNTPQWTGVEDIDYFLKQLRAALGVPNAYLNYESDMPSRATLSAEDAHFCKSILRLQKMYRSGMRQVCMVHLASQGIDPMYVDYELMMTVPSAIFELAQLEVQNTRAQFASVMGELVSKHWILSKIFGLSDAEIEEIMKQRDQEMKAMMAQQGGGMGGRFESANIPLSSPVRDPVFMPNGRQVLTASRSKLYPLEQDLFAGHNVAFQRSIESKMDRVLHENRSLAMSMAQTGSLLNELRGAIRPQSTRL